MHPRAVVHVGDSIRSDLLGALGCGMRAILLSRNDFKRSAADEAAGRPPADDARWREVYTLLLTTCYTCSLLRLLLATCHLPPATYLVPLLTGARCATWTRRRRCCGSGARSRLA